MSFKAKYGPWAVVAGGSVGMGGAFCDRLAKEGLNVVVTGRHQDTVDEKCRQLTADFGVKAKGAIVDMGDLDALSQMQRVTSNLEVGMLVYNAGLADMALFPERDINYEMYRLNVNTRSMLSLSLWYSKGMMERKRGGMIFLSSCGGIVGTPFIQTYSATKAYAFTLAEALWGELSDFNIDVLSVLPGNTIGQNFAEVPAGTPGFQTGAEVVEEAFHNFGKVPAFIAGESNRQMLSAIFTVEARMQYISAMKQSMAGVRAEFGSGTEK